MKKQTIAAEKHIDKKKRQVRETIIKVAIDLFENQGYEKTTMEQIAEKANVARKTLYNYFPVKDAIVDDYLRDISHSLANVTLEKIRELPDARSRLLYALNNTYGWVEENKELTNVVMAYRYKSSFQNNNGNLKKTGTSLVLESIIQLGQEEGEIQSNLPANLLATYLDLLRGTMVMEWLMLPVKEENPPVKLNAEIAKLVDLFLYGTIAKRSESK